MEFGRSHPGRCAPAACAPAGERRLSTFPPSVIGNATVRLVFESGVEHCGGTVASRDGRVGVGRTTRTVGARGGVGAVERGGRCF